MSKNGKKQGGIILKKYNKIIGLLLAVALLLPGMATKVSAAENDVTRLAGDNRIETSIKISKDAYANGSAAEVVLAGWEGKADALTGTYLASAKKAPLLFTRGGSLDTDLLEELERLGAKTVYALGGTTVISDSLVTALEAKGMKVERVSGDNRFATAEAAAKKVSATAKHVFLAYGWDELADALAVGPASAKEGMPILLTETNALRPETVTAMKNLGVEKVTILGGTAVVSKAIEDKLVADLGAANVTRVSGANRFSTATAIAGKYFAGATKAIVANSNPENNPDALVAGYFGALRNAPIVLTPAATLHETTAAYLKANVKEAYIVGGTTAVNAAVEAETKTAITPLDAAVVSVSAINAAQVKVVFNAEVDSATANAQASYKENGVNTAGTPLLQDDNKTVIITYAASQNNKSVAMKVTGVKSKDLLKTVEDYEATVTFNDTVAPTITKAEYVGGKVVLTFSEPIQAAPSTFRVNGNPVSVAFVAGSQTKVEATVALTANATATIYAAGVKDIAGNEMALYNGSVVAPAADTIKPVITTIKQISENTVRVVFSEALGATASELGVGELKFLKDGALNTTDSTVVKNTTIDSTGKTYDVAFTGAEIYGTPAKDSVTVTLVLAKDAVKDAAGNGNDAFTQSFTFNADKTGPVLVSSEVASSTKVEVTFDEIISAVDSTKVIVTNADGVRFTINGAAVNGSNNKVADITFGSALANGTYTFNFQADAVTDAHTNKSLAFTTTVIVGDAADAVKPVATITNKAGVKNVFVVAFNNGAAGALEEVTSSAINLNNYKLDGVALPANTDIYFTSAAKDTVEIVLPVGTINIGNQTTGANAVLSVSNVADKAGNVMVAKSGTVVINDNTAATISAVQVIGQDVYVTFTEDVTVAASTDIADVFTLKDGTTTVTEAAGKEISAVAGNAKQVKFALTAPLTGTLTVKVKTAQTDLKDVNGIAVK